MVFKKSEYRKQYRDPSWETHYGHYREKVDYRLLRRCLEHRHQVIEWDWDSQSSRSRDDDNNNANNSNSRRQGVRGRGPRGKTGGGVASSDEGRLSGCDRPRDDQAHLGPAAGQPPHPSAGGDVEQHQDGQPAQSAGKQPSSASRRRLQAKDRTRARPGTAPSQRPRGDDRPPLVAFGWADRELTTGDKRTHNIRASADPLQVYPSALRAMRRRELEIQRRTSADRQHHNLREQKLRAMFNVPPRDDTVWLTEYQRNYVGPSARR